LHDLPPKPVKTPKRRVRRKETHPAFGIWADRKEINDAALFSLQLRQQIQSRKDGRG
jgi:hypothetical protein